MYSLPPLIPNRSIRHLAAADDRLYSDSEGPNISDEEIARRIAIWDKAVTLMPRDKQGYRYLSPKAQWAFLMWEKRLFSGIDDQRQQSYDDKVRREEFLQRIRTGFRPASTSFADKVTLANAAAGQIPQGMLPLAWWARLAVRGAAEVSLSAHGGGPAGGYEFGTTKANRRFLGNPVVADPSQYENNWQSLPLNDPYFYALLKGKKSMITGACNLDSGINPALCDRMSGGSLQTVYMGKPGTMVPVMNRWAPGDFLGQVLGIPISSIHQYVKTKTPAGITVWKDNGSTDTLTNWTLPAAVVGFGGTGAGLTYREVRRSWPIWKNRLAATATKLPKTGSKLPSVINPIAAVPEIVSAVRDPYGFVARERVRSSMGEPQYQRLTEPQAQKAEILEKLRLRGTIPTERHTQVKA